MLAQLVSIIGRLEKNAKKLKGEQDALQVKIEKAKRLMAEGDKLFEAGDYSGAIDKYAESKKEYPLEGIEGKIATSASMATYKELLRKGKAAMAADDYAVALEFFKQAQTAKNTAEVRKLLQRAQRGIVFKKHYDIGVKAFAEKDYKTAVENLEIALQNVPDKMRKEVDG